MRESGPSAGESIQDEVLGVFVEESSRLAGDSLKNHSADAGGESRRRPSALCRMAMRKCECDIPRIEGCHMQLCRRKLFGSRRMRYSRSCGRNANLKDGVTG